MCEKLKICHLQLKKSIVSTPLIIASLRLALGSLDSVKEYLNASGYQDILDKSLLPSWEQFRVQGTQYLDPTSALHKARFIQLDVFIVKELDWRTQSLVLSLIKHFWDELVEKLQMSNITASLLLSFKMQASF